MTRVEVKMCEPQAFVRLAFALFCALAAALGVLGCGKTSVETDLDGGSVGGSGPALDAGSQGGTPGSDSGVSVGTVMVSTATRRPRTTTWSINYWQWMPSYGDYTTGTEALVAELKPAVLRVGGYNNDANLPDPFDNAEIDRAVTCARAIGAEPLIQVPLLADIDGSEPTAATAAAMVTYANVTQGYGVKYFSIGNEPDLYVTQGSRRDQNQPAIPNYTPFGYCTSVRAYVTAMKAVDPTITIVGPDLSWHYVAGNDWLTPILQSCGDLFDIVSIHRYPLSSTQATLQAASVDATLFGALLTSIRGIMQSTGTGDKPLALTEMNVVYEESACAIEASPGTLGSALWLADGLGTAIENNLWTSAVWDISDPDVWGMGLLSPPPTHTPRPEYYAYQLYADHFGTALVDVVQQPSGIRAYASRNQADNATDLIVVNWTTSSAPLSFQVTGLSSAPAPAIFTIPASSISAIEIPDIGGATAWTYGDAQHETGQGIATLAPGVSAAIDAGPAQLDNACSSDASDTCPTVVLPSAPITTLGSGSGNSIFFGSAPYQWGLNAYGSNGQTPPSATLTPDGDGLHIVGGFVPPVTQNWVGVVLYFASTSCIDASQYQGVAFDYSGDLGGCTLSFGVNFSQDESTVYDARGSCTYGASCYAPFATLKLPTQVDGGTGNATRVQVPFTTMVAGSPIANVDQLSILLLQWQLSMPSGSTGCSADFTVENVAFY